MEVIVPLDFLCALIIFGIFVLMACLVAKGIIMFVDWRDKKKANSPLKIRLLKRLRKVARKSVRIYTQDESPDKPKMCFHIYVYCDTEGASQTYKTLDLPENTSARVINQHIQKLTKEVIKQHTWRLWEKWKQTKYDYCHDKSNLQTRKTKEIQRFLKRIK